MCVICEAGKGCARVVEVEDEINEREFSIMK